TIFLWDADLEAPYVTGQSFFKVRYRQLDGCRILRVIASHGAQQDGAIAHTACHGSSLIQGGGKGDYAPSRTAAIGRFQPDDSGEGCRLTDRSSRIGAGHSQGAARRDRRCRATGGPARYEFF